MDDPIVDAITALNVASAIKTIEKTIETHKKRLYILNQILLVQLFFDAVKLGASFEELQHFVSISIGPSEYDSMNGLLTHIYRTGDLGIIKYAHEIGVLPDYSRFASTLSAPIETKNTEILKHYMRFYNHKEHTHDYHDTDFFLAIETQNPNIIRFVIENKVPMLAYSISRLKDKPELVALLPHMYQHKILN